MNEDEKKKLFEDLEVKKKELSNLKTALNELNVQKEAWLEKKRKASNEISERVSSIRDAKGKRNNFTKQVKDSKNRREELNIALKQKLDEMKNLQNEKNEITRKFGIQIDPSKIKQEIEQLELSIETEALPFSVEQRIMKKIAEKKKVLDQAKEISDVFDKIHEVRKELDRIRKKADETHKKVQSKAEASQQFHEEFVESAKDIKDLREKEESALKNFVELKAKYTVQNDLVRSKIEEINAIRNKLEGVHAEDKKKSRKEEENILIEKERDVEEKIKKGMKLTTEDLLAFQAKEQMSQKHDSGDRRKH